MIFIGTADLLTSVTESVYSTVGDAVYRVDGLSPDTRYEFYVIAKDEKGTASKPSPTLVVTTQVNLPVIQGSAARVHRVG